ncbi:flagellar hook-associated protein FlgK [Humitalea sp. 24SJ18S-53]|uniref:flagellar hook-associated protein FlgK n=1 Tax=Humitalea sp. 24SJ18S-53 TaxID=3422307 RepID=UPI003D66E794
MSLDVALTSSQSGLALVNRQLGAASQNVANAAVAGFTRKTVEGRALTADGLSFGVRSLQAQRDVDAALQTQIEVTRASRAAAAVREAILRPVEAAHGTPGGDGGGGDSAGDLTASLHAAFVALRADPSDAPRQNAVVAAANDLAERFNAVGDAIQTARQESQDAMQRDVATLNSGLRDIGVLTREIQSLQSRGLSTAAMEDKRDTAIGGLSEVLELKAIRQADGGVLLIARGGTVLPTDGRQDPFSLAPATVAPGTWHGAGGTLPGVMLGGVDVTNRLMGGTLAEHVALRDSVLPRQQAEVDVAAANVAGRLNAQGLALFVDGAGAVPDPALPYATGGWIGLAGTLRVNPAIIANPALARDGTHAVAGFTPNPAAGPAGFATLLTRVDIQAFGAESAPGVPHPGFANSGLGPDGTLSSTLSGARTLQEQTANLVAAHGADRLAATEALSTGNAFLSLLEARAGERSGVDVDREMASLVSLQTAYAANARVMSAVQTMYDTLLAAVR